MGQFRAGWRWSELLGLIGIALALWVLSRIPGGTWVLYPFVLFKTYVHEFWHGLAAWLTGGQFLRFEIYPDTSGMAWTAGGSAWVIASAGYLGASLTGAVLVILAARGFPAALLLGALGVGMILLGLLLASNAFGLWMALVLGALLLAALQLPPAARDGVLLVLAASLALDALNSLWVLSHLAWTGEQHTDAAAMAALTGLPAWFWAWTWILLSLALLAFALRLAYRRAPRGSTLSAGSDRSRRSS